MRKETFVALALSYLGYPAVFYSKPSKGRSISGFDCSGFIHFLLTSVGYPEPIPRLTNDLFDTFGVCVHEEFAGCGDLVFISRSGLRPTHVGIVVSPGVYIDSPGRDGGMVEMSLIENGPIAASQDDAGRIYFRNPIGYKRICVKNGRYNVPFFE